eukprot:64265-Pyramimonas_sp.AAC.1
MHEHSARQVFVALLRRRRCLPKCGLRLVLPAKGRERAQCADAYWHAACLAHAGAEGAREAVAAGGVRLCALGNDAGALEAAGYPCHVLPQEASTLGLVRELEASDEARGARIVRP